MKILLKKLQIVNFKGCKSRTIEFDEQTVISGANRTGKTTLFDAFMWLLFGKNSSDSKDFSIKPYSVDHKTTDRLDNEVSAVLEIDGSIQTYKRVQREKWVKPRGEAVAVNDGNEILYFINDVPTKAGDYNKAISSLMAEQTFKLITSPAYFPSLNWSVKRDMLFHLAGGITDKDIAEGNPEFEQLLSMNSNLVKLKQELSAKKLQLKKALDEIPHRIDEAMRSKPEPVDKLLVESQVAELQNKINDIEGKIASELKAHQATIDADKLIMTNIANLSSEKAKIATDERQKLFELSTKQSSAINEVKGEISKLDSDITSRKSGLSILEKQLAAKQSDLEAKRKEATELQAATPKFEGVEACCPTCKRDFPSEDVEAKKKELTENFNKDKVAKLKHLVDVGGSLKAEVERIESVIATEQNIINTLTGQKETLSSSLKTLQEITTSEAPTLDSVLSKNAQYIQLTNDILELEARPKTDPVNNDELVAVKKTYQEEINILSKSLSAIEQIEKTNVRIAELEKETTTLSQSIADLEKTEFAIERFTRAKIDTVESRINSMFSKVTFLMYKKQINGGENETCEILVNGVPYPDVNNADKINAGIDIINTFAKHAGVTAPIFVDNAEAVNELIETESQLIQLVVTTEPEFTIKTHSKSESFA